MSNEEKPTEPTLTAEQLEYQRDRWNTAILRIYKKQPFYRKLLGYMDMKESQEVKAPCWVARDKSSSVGLSLGYNPVLLAEVTDGRSMLGLVMHELMHVVLQHFDRVKPLMDWCKDTGMPFSPVILNKAQDMAINHILISWGEQGSDLMLDERSWFHMTGCHIYRRYDKGKQCLVANEYGNLEDMQACEYYFKKLTKDLKDKIKDGKVQFGPNSGQSGNHDWIYDLSGDQDQQDPQKPPDKLSEIQKGMLDKAVREGINEDQAFGKMAGKTSLGQELEMLYPVKEVKQNWQNLLKMSVCSGAFLDTKVSMAKMNRRLVSLSDDEVPCKFPAKKKVRDFEIVWIQDTSGSVDNDAILDGMGVLMSLKSYKPNLILRAIDWDMELQRESLIHNKDDVRQYASKVKGRGGTEFANAIEYVVKNYHPDTIIYCTDGYGNAGDGKSVKNINFIWLLTVGGTKPCDWGTVVQIEKD